MPRCLRELPNRGWQKKETARTASLRSTQTSSQTSSRPSIPSTSADTDDILCIDDIPYQCQTCQSHFKTGANLALHCFVEGHQQASTSNYSTGKRCECGCNLIGISVDAERSGDNKLYSQSQLWQCSQCGMLWKCVECGELFKGARMFKQHLHHCNTIQEVLKRMKTEKNSDEESKENHFIKEEKHTPSDDVKCSIKPKLDIKSKIEKRDLDLPRKLETGISVKQEWDSPGIKCETKPDLDVEIKSDPDS